MEMDGDPITGGGVCMGPAEGAGVFEPAKPTLAPPAAPAASRAIQTHLELPPDWALPVSAARVSVTATTREARAEPLPAVTRIWTSPGALPHFMPHAAARPSAPAGTISVRLPVGNWPVGPCSGNWKLTVAPETLAPAASVTSIVMPRAERDPT